MKISKRVWRKNFYLTFLGSYGGKEKYPNSTEKKTSEKLAIEKAKGPSLGKLVKASLKGNYSSQNFTDE